MTNSSPPLQPMPRRNFEMTPVSTTPSTPATPRSDSLNEPDVSERQATNRTRSILNLTSSTLFGIYSPGDENAREGPSTPRSHGAQTPARQPNPTEQLPTITPISQSALRDTKITPHHSGRNDLSQQILRSMVLFILGMAYGLLITLLYDQQQLGPVRVDRIDRHSWSYLLSWGAAAIFLGGLLPWVDVVFEDTWGDKAVASNMRPATPSSRIPAKDEDERRRSGADSGLGADWNPVVRGIGAFIGIVFAIVRHLKRATITLADRTQRRLPWQSTLQVSLTLAIVNPVLWYIVDRSKPGFVLSTFVGIIGTVVMLSVNPEIIPTPALPLARDTTKFSFHDLMQDGPISNENIGVVAWIASVLFCSTVCFGNMGRKLALGHAGKKS